MPSQTTSWITKHDHLAVLHVASTDPRRAGVQDLAMFEADLLPILSMYKYRIRHGQIETLHGKSLLGIITGIRKMGTMQLEPNCDFTIGNLGKRAAPTTDGMANLDKFKKVNPNWKDIIWKAKHGCDLFPSVKYRNRDEWVTLNIALVDGGSIDIKVNKWLVGKIPTKLVYRPKRQFNQLFLLPNSAQLKRPKYDNDRRHGRALTAYILDQAKSNAMITRLRDRFDYRIDQLGDFVQSCNVKNQWFDVEGGCVLKITLPEGFCIHAWDKVRENVYPQKEIIPARDERVGYFFMTETIADVAKDFHWLMNELEAVCSKLEYQNLKGNRFRLVRLVCELSGIPVTNVIEPARISKYYEAAINGTDDRSLRRRAKFENALSSEQATSNHMYVQSKFVSNKRIHADKFIKIPELNITAVDLRIDSIRVGGSK